MDWLEIRCAYPDQWLIIEALEAHTTQDNLRKLDKLAVVEQCSDGDGAFQSYRRLHREHPEREFYFVHTSRETLDIHEQQWLGIRRSHAAIVER